MSSRGTPTRPGESPQHIELQAGADVHHHEQPGPSSELLCDRSAHNHQDRHLGGDADNGRAHPELTKTLPVVHRLLLHLRELKKKRDAGGDGS
jgi:hypothetical protein